MTRVQPARRARKVPLVLKARKATKAWLAQAVRKVPKAHKVLRARRVRRVLPALLVQPELRVPQVSRLLIFFETLLNPLLQAAWTHRKLLTSTRASSKFRRKSLRSTRPSKRS